MARRAVLGGGSLNPFGGGGTDFGAFNIVDPGNEAYLAFLKVETAWNAGKADDAAYLAALEVYANAQKPESSDWVSVHARLDQARYQVNRNILLQKIDDRKAAYSDLVAFDKSSLSGLVADSQEYRQRLDLYRQSQARLVSDQEQKQVDLYQAGKLTTTQLQKWYTDVLNGPVVDNNPDLEESLKSRITELRDRVLQEKDSKMLSDFNDGKIRTTDFIAYATAAKARYAAGTTQAQEWDSRIRDARDNANETALLYRYNLSQEYAQLQQFVKSNSGRPSGGTSTSTSKRTILGPDGQWHTVTSTKTKATAPSAASLAAYQKLQIEIADAKAHMAAIARKASSVGGFIASSSILSFYQRKLGTLAKGSAEWYAVQGKIDNVNDRIHQEAVLSKQGIRITYPSGGGGSSSSGGGGHPAAAGGFSAAAPKGPAGAGIGLDQFMRAIASQESGGRYDARNASTGAYGKYQILPSNWSSWAQRAGLPGNAPQTPENQERVARAAFARLASSYHNDWSRVAAAWFAGVAGSANPAAWGPRTRRYVDAIMSKLGTTRSAVSGATAGAPSFGSYSSPLGSRTSPPTVSARSAAPARSGSGGGSGPLAQITGAGAGGRKQQSEVITIRSTGFPTNLDARAFERFYANYERAFESGEEGFVDTSTGRAIAYFVGDDPAERIDRMRHLDDLRVRLYDEKATAYEGTPTELTANNQRNEAYKDVARHEYLIVDTGTGKNASAKINAAVNPLASGIRLLDKTKAAIQSNVTLGVAAYKRGDVTGAYAFFQMAQDLMNANGGAIQNLALYASAANAKIKGIEQATGGISPEEALGQDKGATLRDDLKRLGSFDAELRDVFDAKATETLADLKSHLKLAPGGQVMWDNPGDPRSQLLLTDDTIRILKPNGDIEISSAPPSVHNGQVGYHDPKMVTVTVKSGANVFQAQAQYTVGEVGSFVDPNDPNNLLPIMGKIVQQRRPDGKWVTFYENPLAPGSKNGWSATPWVYQTGPGFKSTPDGKGGSVYSWGGGGGDTYKLIFDPKTATYAITRDNPGGLFKDAVKDEFVASIGNADAAAILAGGGFQRTGGGSFDGEMPVFGFDSQQDYKTWLRSFQPPALAGVEPLTGGPSLEDRDAAFANRSGGPSLEERDAAYAARQASEKSGALARRDRAEQAMFGSQDRTASQQALKAGAIASRNRAERLMAGSDVTRPGSVIGPGLSPDERDEIARRAALPKQPDAAWLAGQVAATAAAIGAGARKVTPPPAKKPAAPKPVVPKKKPTVAASKLRHPLPKVAPPPARTTYGNRSTKIAL